MGPETSEATGSGGGPLRVAVVTTPASSASNPSSIGGYVRALLPHLAERCRLDVFVEGPDDTGGGVGELAAPRLDPQRFDRILYQLGNEPAHAFMLPMIRALGGVVVLHDWQLAEAAAKAYPALERGGLAGFLAAVREGGLGEARAWRSRPAVPLAMNRSAVRFGDAFLVHSSELKQRVLRERNAFTPVGVLENEGDPPALAAEVVRFLEDMPPHRSKKRAGLALQVLRELRARKAEAQSEGAR
jgi:hypothetical protein